MWIKISKVSKFLAPGKHAAEDKGLLRRQAWEKSIFSLD